LADKSGLEINFLFNLYILSKLRFNLSKNELYMDPITLANLSMSNVEFSRQSVNRSEIYSYSIGVSLIKLFFILSIDVVRHFLKIY
jgi:hypothetical protein